MGPLVSPLIRPRIGPLKKTNEPTNCTLILAGDDDYDDDDVDDDDVDDDDDDDDDEDDVNEGDIHYEVGVPMLQC